MLWFSKKQKLAQVDTSTKAGLIVSYNLSDPVLKPVFKNADKGNRAWKKPVFIEEIIKNPAPLLLQEKWLYDKKSFELAFNELNNEDSRKLEEIFKHNSRFQPISFQELLEENDIDPILEVMELCDYSNNFHHVIEPLNEQYGWYGYPNNFQFERMNAAIITVITSKFPKITPLDDYLRLGVYEHLNITSNSGKSLKNLTNVAHEATRSSKLLPLEVPSFQTNWQPQEFINIYESQGAYQLRQVVQRIQNISTLNRNNDELFKEIQKAQSEYNLLSSEDIVGASLALIGSALAFATIPIGSIFWIPAGIATHASIGYFFEKFTKNIEINQEKESYQFLETLKEIQKWG